MRSLSGSIQRSKYLNRYFFKTFLHTGHIINLFFIKYFLKTYLKNILDTNSEIKKTLTHLTAYIWLMTSWLVSSSFAGCWTWLGWPPLISSASFPSSSGTSSSSWQNTIFLFFCTINFFKQKQSNSRANTLIGAGQSSSQTAISRGKVLLKVHNFHSSVPHKFALQSHLHHIFFSWAQGKLHLQESFK